jgi:ParB-like chromosome segregation protein Spo0J
MERKLIGIAVVRIDGDTQSREEINETLIAEYAANMEEGSVFPAILTFFDGVNYWLADGFHRYFAAKKLGRGSIESDVRSGTNRDAWLYSLGANSKHGARRTNSDKRKSVRRALDDFELQEWSNSEIARQCDVSVGLVASMRGTEAPDVRKFKMADGTVAEKRVPKKAEKPASEPAAEEPAAEGGNEHEEMVAELVAENERVNDRLAVAAMEGTPEEKAMAAETIETLREELRVMKIELVAVKQSRDQFQAECAQLKKQCAMYVKKLKALEK